jgi:hypothetical protein
MAFLGGHKEITLHVELTKYEASVVLKLSVKRFMG